MVQRDAVCEPKGGGVAVYEPKDGTPCVLHGLKINEAAVTIFR
jgi:hypothetical protein